MQSQLQDTLVNRQLFEDAYNQAFAEIAQLQTDCDKWETTCADDNTDWIAQVLELTQDLRASEATAQPRRSEIF